MAFQSDNTLITNREMFAELLAAPFRALGRLMIFLGDNNSRTQALQSIAALSDAQLSARGMTRADAVSQVFRHDA
jgi:hypothetical protein